MNPADICFLILLVPWDQQPLNKDMGLQSALADTNEVSERIFRDVQGRLVQELHAVVLIFMAESFIYHPMDLSSGATATAADILNGKTAVINGEIVTGTMPNRGNISASIDAGSSYTIPQGYHAGFGKVTAIDPYAPVSRSTSATLPTLTGTGPNWETKLSSNLVISVPSGYNYLTGFTVTSPSITITNLSYTTSWAWYRNSYCNVYAGSTRVYSTGNGNGMFADDDKNWTTRPISWYNINRSSGMDAVNLSGISRIILCGNGTGDYPELRYYANHNSGESFTSVVSGYTGVRITFTCWFKK